MLTRNPPIASKFFKNVAKFKHLGRITRTVIAFRKKLRAD
jgi:hypothetical protein